MPKFFCTTKGPKAIGPYSTAVIACSCCFVSGMLGVKPETGELAGDVLAQARQALENLRTVLHEMELDMSMVVKTTVFLQDLSDFAAVNEIYQEYFSTNYPARSCVQVARLPKDARIEIEAVAQVE